MSSKNYKIIHNKTQPQHQFRQDPLQINNQFSVYLTVPPNVIEELIRKDQSQPRLSLVDKITNTSRQVTSPKTDKNVTFTNPQLPTIQNDQNQISQQTPIPNETEIPKKDKIINPHTMSVKQLKGSLLFDDRTNSIPKTTIQNGIIDDIVKNGEIIVRKPVLLNQVQNLKRLHLLKQYNSNHQQLPGVGKLPYVLNDYHSKSTNNGYSRNNKGSFFTR